MRFAPRFWALAGLLLAGALAVPSLVSARPMYVTNKTSSNVSVIDTAANSVVGTPIGGLTNPYGIAITPDGKHAYVVNLNNTVSVIDTQTKATVGSPVPVGAGAAHIAIAPDGKHAYVASDSADTVSVIDTQKNSVVATIPTGGSFSFGIVVSPDGKRAYVTNELSDNVSVIDTETNATIGSPIPVQTAGLHPAGVGITPDGKLLFIADDNSATGGVTVIDAQAGAALGPVIPTGGAYTIGIAVSPDGKRAYAVNGDPADTIHSVTVIDTATRAPLTTVANTGLFPIGIAVTPDSKSVYVAGSDSNDILRIDPTTNTLSGTTITVGSSPITPAIFPDQPPQATFTAPTAISGAPVTFSAAASTDPDGSIAIYAWDFGDGTTTSAASPTITHTFGKPGTYPVTLTLTDNEGCSTSIIFTGQTAACNGSAVASQTQMLKVAPPALHHRYPKVRIRCPKSSKPQGCKVALKAVTKKRKGKAETKIAKARLRAGRSTLVTLIPKAKYGSNFETATRVLVQEKLTIDGRVTSVFRRLKLLH
jgi:YVTN family beta-propeller protein